MTLPYVQIPDRRLTENFTLYEFLRSDTAAKHGIDNTPNEEQVARIEDLARVLQGVRGLLSSTWGEEVAIDISSGFRAEALNEAVRGVDDSDHLQGGAADITARLKSGPGLREREVARVAALSPLSFDQIIWYPPWLGTERLHFGVRGFGQDRREILTRTATAYQIGIVD